MAKTEEEKLLSLGARATWEVLRDHGPSTKISIVEATKFSERSVRNYLAELFDRNLIKEMPNFGRTKIYATIDYIPVMDERKPLAQRWQVWSPASNTRFTVGELATYYGQGILASSIQAAELLLKAPALICYYAQEKNLTEKELTDQLKALQDVLSEATDQLQSAIAVFGQLLSDPRYWRPDMLKMFTASPDFPLPNAMPSIISRLTEEMEQSNDNEHSAE